MKVFGIIVAAACASSAFAQQSGSGLVVLDQSASGALSMTGNSTVRIPARAIYVNSSHASAVRTTGNATMDVPTVYIVGGFSFTGQSGCTGAVVRSASPYVNPFQNTAFPSAASGPNRGEAVITGGSRALSAGYYPSGIRVSGNANVTFAPGVYILGGDFRVTSGALSGAGVCFVMLNGAMSIAGCSSLQLSPMTDGSLNGMVITQPSSNHNGMSLVGGSEVAISGSIYVPGATLTMTGNSSVAGVGPQMGDLVVANRVTMTGTSIIMIGRPQYAAVELPKMPLFD